MDLDQQRIANHSLQRIKTIERLMADVSDVTPQYLIRMILSLQLEQEVAIQHINANQKSV